MRSTRSFVAFRALGGALILLALAGCAARGQHGGKGHCCDRCDAQCACTGSCGEHCAGQACCDACAKGCTCGGMGACCKK